MLAELNYLEWLTVLKALEYTDKKIKQLDLSEIITKVREITESKQNEEVL